MDQNAQNSISASRLRSGPNWEVLTANFQRGPLRHRETDEEREDSDPS